MMQKLNYDLDDLKKLNKIIEDILHTISEDGQEPNEAIAAVHAALAVIISKNVPQHAKKYICIDDCPQYTGQGFNAMLFDMPFDQLLKNSNLLITAGYLGKAIIVWRTEIKK